MDKILFTEENLSKIHISQFEQFLIKYNVEYNTGAYGEKNDHIWFHHGEKDRMCAAFRFYGRNYTLSWSLVDGSNDLMNNFDILCAKIHPDYVQGDLTQFHVLFTQVYNEIMEYEIK